MILTVVSYSRAHFDPQGSGAPHERSSAGALAKAVYEGALEASQRVVYVDANEVHAWPKLEGVTCVIGIENGLASLVKKYRPTRSLLFAVNQEATSSTAKWFEPIRRESLPLSSLIRSYDVWGRDPRAARVADRILMVGDNVTTGSYLRLRRANEVYSVAYGHGGLSGPPATAQPRHILFPASSIGVRKGSDLVEALCRTIDVTTGLDLKVVLMGAPSCGYWREEIERWQNEFPTTFRYVGWVDPKTVEYGELMSGSFCAVIPSREEGLVGTAVEAIRSHVPTFASIECGLGPRPTQFVLRPEEESLWPTQIIEFCARRAKECAAPLITAVESTQFASTQAVREAVSRFVTTGEVVPAHWLSQDGPTLHIGRRRTEGSISLSSWLEHFGADFHYGQELDQVLVGSSLLVALPEGASVSLERDLEDAPADGSFSHDRIRSECLAGSTRHRVLITMRVKEWSPKTVRLGFKESYPDVQESVRHLPINGKVWAARWFALHLAWRVRRWRSWSRFWLATVRPSRQTVRHDD